MSNKITVTVNQSLAEKMRFFLFFCRRFHRPVLLARRSFSEGGSELVPSPVERVEGVNNIVISAQAGTVIIF
jgi:hypothetical protein